MRENNIEIKGFHAHIYYDAASRGVAAHVREELGARFEVQLGSWHDNPVGPHPKAMYQLAFLPNQFANVVSWLMLNRGGLDVLVHPETGDEVVDHTDHSLWLGEKLDLNIERLKKYVQARTSSEVS
ncbi:DOPA 4,5-dioxygenase family protein [Nostoc sp. UHCC 0302]|uniref:DOPA 4,5-dioxygenase family protein n=1 Tax=Nostoc sp. UHCC 0302 TaxID=3134896 RepID=UPI00311C8C31